MLSLKYLLLAALSLFTVTEAYADNTKVKSDTLGTLRAMLGDYHRYADAQWHTDTQHVELGYWGSGRGDGGNEGVRAISTTALAEAVLGYENPSHAMGVAQIGPALRYASAIHFTGAFTGTDGKHWGHSWQSAMWTANLGVAAWLVKDQLDAETMDAVKRVVADEADQFIGQNPPTMEPGDTKSEENAWDLTAPAAALLLMPQNAHAQAWNDAVLRYGFNTLSVEADKTSLVSADGKTIADWVTTTQLYPDFTLENHGIFHPVYAMIGAATNGQAAVMYRLGGKPIPDALTYNVLKEWQMLQYIALPDGEWLYPQGLDWDLHDYEHLHYWAMLATLFHDPSAAVLEQRLVGYARRRQVLNGDGSFVGPSGSLGFAREAVQAERVAFALLMHEKFGDSATMTPKSWSAMVQRLSPVRVFSNVGMAIHRTPSGLVSLSWKNHLMAQIVPESDTHLDQPYVTTPNLATLIGSFAIKGQSADQSRKFHVRQQFIVPSKDSLAVNIDADVNNGLLHQQIAFVSLGSGVVAYLDRVFANQPVTVTEERGLLLGIENDEVSGNTRQLKTVSGLMNMPGGQGTESALAGHWANIDDRLGLVSALGTPLRYLSASKPNRAGAREDILVGSYSNTTHEYDTGTLVAARAGLVLLNATSKATAQSAAKVKVNVLPTTGTMTLTFVTSDGKSHQLALAFDGSASFDRNAIK